MAVQISAADRDKIVRQLGRDHKPAPDWVIADPRLSAIYDEAAAGKPAKHHQDEPAKPAAKPASSSSGRSPSKTTRAGKRPARTSTRRSTSGRRSRTGPSVGGELTKVATGHATAGGLMLALLLYPVGLSLLKYGWSGLADWARAKFLNDANDDAKYNTPGPQLPAAGGSSSGGGYGRKFDGPCPKGWHREADGLCYQNGIETS